MIDLFGIASSVLGDVNPMREITLRKSLGVAQTSDFLVSPQFEDLTVLADIQATSTGELQLTENMEQQAEMRAVYLSGAAHALNRPLQIGGDLLVFEGSDWLITNVLEQWGEKDWCKVLVTRQIPSQQTLD
ncbi:hypothetical protein FAI40_10070 [Acetobacteraceae bacterium]|nr:hypothetical protein FAI40_10070 [Acetobacteraceae bacterium]